MEDIEHQLENEIPEVIALNVGGVNYTTSKSTLMRDKSSMLAALFSGRYRIPKDPKGRFFIDRDGKHFAFILAFLRGESCHPPPHLAVKILEEAEYFQLHGLTELLQDHPTVFQVKLNSKIEDKFQTQFWEHEIVRRSQRMCLETLSPSSCVSLVCGDVMKQLLEEPSCVSSQHSILVTKFMKTGPKQRQETFDRLAERIKDSDFVIDNVRLKDTDIFLSSLRRRLDEDQYDYSVVKETAACKASSSHQKSKCDFAVEFHHIEFFWADERFKKGKLEGHR